MSRRILLEGEQKLRTLDFDQFRKLEKWRGDFDLRVASGMSVHVEPEQAPKTANSSASQRRTGLSEIKSTKTRTEQKMKKRQKQLLIFHDTDKVRTCNKKGKFSTKNHQNFKI